MRTLPELFAQQTLRLAGRPALVSGDQVLTFGGLREHALALAAELVQRGVRPGARVGLMLRNSPEFVIAYWAILATGALAVPLNEHYQQNELAYFIDECELSLLLTDATLGDVCASVMPRTMMPCTILLSEDWHGLPRSREWQAPVVDPNASVMLQFSSGSTGRPKRIERSHSAILWELAALTKSLEMTPDDRFLGVTPFSHVNGLTRSMLASFYAGAALYPVARFDRQGIADLIERAQLTVFIAVPFMFISLAQTRFEPAVDFSSLRLCVSASAPFPAKYNREFYGRFGRHVRQLYGSTETGTMSVNLDADIAETLESVGTPLPGIRFAIRDELARPAQAGVVGEVLVASPGAISGYEGLPELNAEAFRDGYFHTGDLGRLDSRGRLYLLGRIKFQINKGGFKVDPREVEAVLEAHPAVDVVAVLGVPAPFGDERVKAVIVRKGPCTEAELVEFCRGKIADFKVPSVFEFREELPTSPTGKILRAKLKA